jgi:TonB family protein
VETPVPRRRATARQWAPAALVAVLILGGAAFLLAPRPRKAGAFRAPVVDAKATIVADSADLLREPEATAAAAGTLPRGERLTILSERGQWLQVRTGKGAEGFLQADAVETDAERSTREERGKKILAFTPVAGVVAEGTELRLAPFASAARAGHLDRGTAVPIYAVDHDFYAVRSADGGLAFVPSSDIDLVPPDPRRPVIVPDAGKTIKDVTVRNLVPSERSPSSSTESPIEAASRESEMPPADEPLQPAVLVSRVDPEYPEPARRSGVEGTVLLDATISDTGQVTQIAVKRGLPLGVSEAAVSAVRRWKYEPARGRGGPVASHKEIRIVFSLSE